MNSAIWRNQLIRLIFSHLTALSIRKPEEEDNGKHYTPVSERDALRNGLINADYQERCG